MGVIASHDDDSRLGKMGVRFAPSAGTYTATVPVIVNVKDIPANKDVILKWQLQGKKMRKRERQHGWMPWQEAKGKGFVRMQIRSSPRWWKGG